MLTGLEVTSLTLVFRTGCICLGVSIYKTLFLIVKYILLILGDALCMRQASCLPACQTQLYAQSLPLGIQQQFQRPLKALKISP